MLRRKKNKKFGFFKKKSYNMYNNIKNKKKSFTNLTEGTVGDNVEDLQKMLVDIVNLYPSLPIVTIDGVFGSSTKSAIIEFQKLNSIPVTGIVDDMTWDKLRLIHTKNVSFSSKKIESRVTDNSVKTRNLTNGIDYLDKSNNIISEGSQGEYVKILQKYINIMALRYNTIANLTVDGIFGIKTKASVKEFQKLFHLNEDGIVNQETWEILDKECNKRY